MPYVDLNTIHNPATGTVAPAAWGDQVRDNDEALIDPPACSISAAAKTVSQSTTTVLGDSPAATENYDNDAMHSTVSNQSRITIQTAGRYLIQVEVGTAAFLGGNGFLRVSIRVDGTTSYGGQQVKNWTTGATEAVRLLAIRTLVLTAAQYIEVTVHQTVGSSVDFTLDELVVTRFTR